MFPKKFNRRVKALRSFCGQARSGRSSNTAPGCSKTRDRECFSSHASPMLISALFGSGAHVGGLVSDGAIPRKSLVKRVSDHGCAWKPTSRPTSFGMTTRFPPVGALRLAGQTHVRPEERRRPEDTFLEGLSAGNILGAWIR